MSKDRPGTRILLVDDSDDDRCYFKWMFQKSGVPGELLQAEDGEEAIRFLSQATAASGVPPQLPSAMFLDLKMPGRNGFEVLEWIREQPALQWLPVFVLTGSDSPSDITRAQDLGAKAYIVKPITDERIQELLSTSPPGG